LSIINERRAMAENYDERLAGYVEVHTRISEFIEKYPEGSLMNAETSAWGRALAAIGIRVHDSVASANEVRARRTDDEQQTGFASEKQEKYLRRLIGTDADQNLIVGYLEANHHGGRDGGISRAIDKLKEDETRADTLLRLEALATEWDKQQPATETVVPDDEDLPQLDDIARD
jgi:hypothetical protein